MLVFVRQILQHPKEEQILSSHKQAMAKLSFESRYQSKKCFDLQKKVDNLDVLMSGMYLLEHKNYSSINYKKATYSLTRFLTKFRLFKKPPMLLLHKLRHLQVHDDGFSNYIHNILTQYLTDGLEGLEIFFLTSGMYN